MNRDTADDYFLASRNLGWFIVGASIFASNIGSEHLVGLAGADATSGVALAHYELHAWCLLVLGWVFVPFYSRSMVYTMPEFLERRFSPGGGWHELRAALPSDMFNLWKPLIPPGIDGTWAPVKETSRIAWYFNGYYPWLGMLFCAPIIGLWYWTTDQYIVQRALGAPNERQARRGAIFASYLKLLPVWIFIVPGMIALALARTGKAPALGSMVDAAGNAIPDAAQAAFPLMVKAILPAGVRGLVVAGLLAALMSSLAGAFNACSTLFTMDLYQKFRPGVTQHQLVWTGRVATAVLVLIGLIWLPLFQ